MTILRWILTALVSLAFLFFGFLKVSGQPAAMFEEQMENSFKVYGIDRNAVRLIGLSELIGAVLVLFWFSADTLFLAQIGNIILMVVTAGAMSYHARFDSVTKEGLPAVIQFSLNAILLALSFAL